MAGRPRCGPIQNPTPSAAFARGGRRDGRVVPVSLVRLDSAR